MSKLILLISGMMLLTCQYGCFSPTTNTITEYDDAGRVVKVTVTSESVVKTITESTKNKTVVYWDNSWLAGIIVIPPASEVENLTGALKILAGRNDKGGVTLSDKHDAKHLPEIIRSARAGELGVTTSGVTAASSQKTN